MFTNHNKINNVNQHYFRSFSISKMVKWNNNSGKRTKIKRHGCGYWNNCWWFHRGSLHERTTANLFEFSQTLQGNLTFLYLLWNVLIILFWHVYGFLHRYLINCNVCNATFLFFKIAVYTFFECVSWTFLWSQNIFKSRNIIF